MRRKLNTKNKFFIGIFSIIVFAMIGILTYAVILSSKNGKTVFEVSNNSVVFDSESNLLDTSTGGQITKRFNDSYYYINHEKNNYDIGKNPVIYDKSDKSIKIYGTNYQINSDASIIEHNDITSINNTSKPSFYKLSDRVYLIISKEIYTEDKTIFASKYLIVYLDKKGNASILNDAINIKTINPIQLIFDKYTFDVAKELLIINDKSIDLKSIIGSTNEYVEKTENEEIDINLGEFVTKYNQLVGNFQQYVNNNTLLVGSNQQITNNNIVINSSGSSGNNNSNSNNNANQVDNLVNIAKSVSLRGAISSPSYIDVTYLVSDVADKYQAVYLLVTGVINDELVTEKIILDKYASAYRIMDLSPKHEYSISLGYIEKVKQSDGTTILQEGIEDVINVRTTKTAAAIEIVKISKGKVHFNFKMTNQYAIEAGTISLYVDGIYKSNSVINVHEAKSTSGFNSSLSLTDGSIFELRLENATYGGKNVELNVRKKFIY